MAKTYSKSDYENAGFPANLIIPEGITKISESAFFGCDSLRSVHIPDSVTKIGESAFFGCDSLQSVHIPDSVTEIAESAFSGCRLDAYRTESSNFLLEDGLLIDKRNNKLISPAFTEKTEVVIPEGVTEIGIRAFSFCDTLRSVIIPDGVNRINDNAFSNCDSLQRVVIPDSVTEIGKCAFNMCLSLQSINIPVGTTRIGPPL